MIKQARTDRRYDRFRKGFEIIIIDILFGLKKLEEDENKQGGNK